MDITNGIAILLFVLALYNLTRKGKRILPTVLLVLIALWLLNNPLTKQTGVRRRGNIPDYHHNLLHPDDAFFKAANELEHELEYDERMSTNPREGVMLIRQPVCPDKDRRYGATRPPPQDLRSGDRYQWNNVSGIQYEPPIAAKEW